MDRKHYFVILLALLLPVISLSAKDFGLSLDTTAAYEDYGVSNKALDKLYYAGTAIPWFSTPLGAGADLYLSAGIGVEYTNQAWTFIPELLQNELTLRFGWNGELKIGRTYYADPLGFVVNGLFDGARLTVDLGTTTLGVGAWYTGFLYKKRANITISNADLIGYNTKLDYSNFLNTYFAPRRLIAALDWEHPGLAEMIRLKLALIGQFDFTDKEDLHSQYLTAKISVPIQSFVFEMGGCAGLAQNDGTNQFFFAGEAGINWMLPTSIQDSLMLSGRYSSGMINDTLVAFVPVTTESQGNVLKAKLSGLSTLNLGYSARLHQNFSLSLLSSYFILNDLKTYSGLPAGRKGYFLGNEFYGHAVWSPVSDLQLRAGGGVFLPSLGNADPNGKTLWRVDLNLVFAIL